MLHLLVIELIRYQQEDGREPYTEWFRGLRDRMAKARIEARLHQVQFGNLGDCKPVGEGVLELRIDVGAGYRVYCGKRGQLLVCLLYTSPASSHPGFQIESYAPCLQSWPLPFGRGDCGTIPYRVHDHPLADNG